MVYTGDVYGQVCSQIRKHVTVTLSNTATKEQLGNSSCYLQPLPLDEKTLCAKADGTRHKFTIEVINDCDGVDAQVAIELTSPKVDNLVFRNANCKVKQGNRKQLSGGWVEGEGAPLVARCTTIEYPKEGAVAHFKVDYEVTVKKVRMGGATTDIKDVTFDPAIVLDRDGSPPADAKPRS